MSSFLFLSYPSREESAGLGGARSPSPSNGPVADNYRGAARTNDDNSQPAVDGGGGGVRE